MSENAWQNVSLRVAVGDCAGYANQKAPYPSYEQICL